MSRATTYVSTLEILSTTAWLSEREIDPSRRADALICKILRAKEASLISSADQMGLWPATGQSSFSANCYADFV